MSFLSVIVYKYAIVVSQRKEILYNFFTLLEPHMQVWKMNRCFKKPVASGCLLFSISNALSIILMNLVVASLPSNSGIFSSSLRKSIAVATEALSVCAAKLTFILFLYKEQMFPFQLVGKCEAKLFLGII